MLCGGGVEVVLKFWPWIGVGSAMHPVGVSSRPAGSVRWPRMGWLPHPRSMTPALPATSPPPNWVEANHPLGWLINRVLAVEPLRQLLFWQARRLIIRTAEGRGIAWRQRREQLQRAAEPLLAPSTSPSLAMPAYYLARFHAYDQGNLCWAAACEAEQATDSMALRVWPEERDLAPELAQLRLRRAIFSAIEPSLTGPVRRVLDLGCSVGVGTFALREWLLERQAAEAFSASGCSPAIAGVEPSRAPWPAPLQVEGLDLSPQMLAVARVREAEALAVSASRAALPAITWHHGAAEATGLPAAAYDLITLQFVCHELPQSASRAVLVEAARPTAAGWGDRPGGSGTRFRGNSPPARADRYPSQ